MYFELFFLPLQRVQSIHLLSRNTCKQSFTMKKVYFLTLMLSVSLFARCQEEGYIIPEDILPKWSTDEELRQLHDFGFRPVSSRGIESPPPFDNLRTMAEWEEIQALTIAWISYPSILKQIVKAAKLETKVVILASNPTTVENYLLGTQGGAPLTDLDNVEIIQAAYNSVWMRDYAGNTVYGSEVDDLLMVDWIYNRPNRPLDDASPEIVADHLGLDLYCITAAPADLVNTGGNFMSDGFGNAFASELILEENEQGNPYGVTPKNEVQIDALLNDYLGISNYIKMETLPFDGIHHIDMHMKLLDEETLLVGKFPDGVSDGPQLEANIEYVLNQTTTKWGTPWRIKWMPMVPNTAGLYPNGSSSSPYYRTFTNSVFVNKTVIIPTYREAFDTTALRIYSELLPGYTLVPIDCDNQPDVIIAASGAIHCITHSVGVEDPLLISHLSLKDTDDNVNPYTVNAYIKHRTGIESATMSYRIFPETTYTEVGMTEMTDDIWSAAIPAQPFGTKIQYFVRGNANSGKTQVRPMPAPEGYWQFRVLSELVGIEEGSKAGFLPVYPNPAGAITCVPVVMSKSEIVSLKLYDLMGREIMTIHNGILASGEKKLFFDASGLASGSYLLVLQSESSRLTQKLMVK